MNPLKLKPLDFAVISVMFMYACSATVTPICFVRMSRQFSLSLSDGGGIETVRSVLIFFTLFLSGFAAAKLGKVVSLFWGTLVMGFGFCLYAAAAGYGMILFATVFIGFGAGILEGLLNPLVQDAHPDDSGRYMNITNAFWSVGVFSTVLAGGALLTWGVSWRLIIAVLAGMSFCVSFFMLSLKKKQPPQSTFSSRVVVHQYLDCVCSGRFWVFCAMMLLAGGAEGAFTFWSASYIQVHFNTQPLAGGIGTACFAAGMMTMRLLGGLLVKQHHLRRLILSSAVAGAAVALAVPFVNSPLVFFPVLFLSGCTIACFWPSIQPYAVDRLGLDATAVFILLSCAGIPGFGFTSLVMGIIGDYAGLTASFFVVPVMLALLALIVLGERAVPPRPAKRD